MNQKFTIFSGALSVSVLIKLDWQIIVVVIDECLYNYCKSCKGAISHNIWSKLCLAMWIVTVKQSEYQLQHLQVHSILHYLWSLDLPFYGFSSLGVSFLFQNIWRVSSSVLSVAKSKWVMNCSGRISLFRSNDNSNAIVFPQRSYSIFNSHTTFGIDPFFGIHFTFFLYIT